MADIYVNHTGSDTPPYDTEAKASTDIQVALDAATDGDTVWIKADENYVMDGVDQQAATFDVDADDNIAIKGYYTSTGDQDVGGAYYKDSSHGWVVIDADSGAFNVFAVGAFSYLVWENLKTINVNVANSPFYLDPGVAKNSYVLQNLALTGGKYAMYLNNLQGVAIVDCEFIGTFGTGVFDAVISASMAAAAGISIVDCLFEIVNVKRCLFIQGPATGASICGNILNISGTVTDCMFVTKGGIINHNIIYENGGVITGGIHVHSTSRATAIYNNIIVGCTTSINDGGGIISGGWNCLYNNGSDWSPLREGDIQSDPQFMDAANGDFRLKPTSPCLNTGKPTPGSGYTSIGAWQRKSLLR